MSAQESAQSFGLSTRAANASYRCFLALEQMKDDEEYGESAEPRMYSYFEEVLKRPNLKTWLAWSDENERFTHEDHRREFYSWIIPGAEEGEAAKLPEAKSVRELSQIIGDESALAILRSPEGSLSRALARYEVDHPEEWIPKVNAALAALRTLTPDMLRNMEAVGTTTLNELKRRIEDTLKDREILVSSRSND